MCPPNKVGIFIYYSYIQANSWKFGWNYTLGTVHIQETLFIPILFLETTIHSKIITENTNTIHGIHTGTIHYSYQRKFLTTKVRQ